jgi:2'-hydroxyisoflavone reductase
MKILVLGGTHFLGRHVVDAALARDHVVTVFNRGNSLRGLPPEVHVVTGDRYGGLAGLRGRRWDAVVDTSGYTAAAVEASCSLLGDVVDSYVFVSSLSVYRSFATPKMTERAPVSSLEDPTAPLTNETYGAHKVRCEREVERVFDGRAVVARAGLLVGPRDNIGRLTWWAQRIASGGDVLAPGAPNRPVQLVDARDAAEWIVRAIEVRQRGTFNLTGPVQPIRIDALFETCRRVAASNARFVWVGDEDLLAAGVAPWTELPLWLPDLEEYRYFFDVDISRALASGLHFRPLAETVADALTWAESREHHEEQRRDFGVTVEPPGISREREAKILADLASRAEQT